MTTVLVACLMIAAHAQPDPRPAPTEIVLVGTIHQFSLLHPGNTPGHLRAVLEIIRPDAIGIENLPDWQATGRHFWIHLPSYAVAERYALRNGIPVYGVDWLPPVECPWPDTAPDSKLERYMATAAVRRNLGAWEARLAFGDEPWSFAAVQGRVERDSSRESVDDPEAHRRHDNVAGIISRLAADNRGKRVAVLIGSSQLFPLKTRLQEQGHVKILDVRSFLPRDAVVSAQDLADTIMLLGAALDSWSLPNMPHARDHRRTRDLLAWLERNDDDFAPYYRARWEMLFGRYGLAAGLLDGLIARENAAALPWPPSSEWAWPPWSSIRHKALFTRAVLHQLEGENTDAERLYRMLLADVPEAQMRPRFRGASAFYDLRPYLEDLIRDPYRGGPWEAFRIQDSLECWPEGRLPAHAWPP